MRYEVQKLNDTDYEFTHIETKESVDGTEVEVIKGRNTLTKEKIEDTIKKYEEVLDRQLSEATEEYITDLINNYKENIEAEIEISKDHIEKMKEMLSYIK